MLWAMQRASDARGGLIHPSAGAGLGHRATGQWAPLLPSPSRLSLISTHNEAQLSPAQQFLNVES